MNAAHLHLLTNHFPVLGTLFGLSLLLIALLRRSDELKRISLGVFIVIALLAVPTYLSGEPAEDLMKNILGVSEVFLEEHEEAAQVAFTGVLILGAASLYGLIWFRRGKIIPAWFAMIVLLVSVGVLGSMVWTANLGGKIRHSEIVSGNSSPVSEKSEHD